ncbi:MAG: hypothetical protein JNN01_19330 [Opitutaceae bacterium]|nr:hypothetical protein [Opitutaceae bacterium]
MKTVFVLWHTYKSAGEEDESKLIGIYESQDAAERAEERTRKLRGFIDHPEDFIIDAYEVGKDQWTGGFVRMKHEK